MVYLYGDNKLAIKVWFGFGKEVSQFDKYNHIYVIALFLKKKPLQVIEGKIPWKMNIADKGQISKLLGYLEE